MPLTVTIPDTVVDKCKQIAPDKTNIESFVIEAVSNYADELKERKDDPFFKFIENAKMSNKENLTDISENHDKYLY
ncbi:MAG: hypothetical protein A2W19_01170 [Spirochaetes bacterium RBG_16_49_21]|nr:MAG: hypothetical protein A2W19_01170 [Spirochaetes bacterium RBG_16_49_21]